LLPFHYTALFDKNLIKLFYDTLIAIVLMLRRWTKYLNVNSSVVFPPHLYTIKPVGKINY